MKTQTKDITVISEFLKIDGKNRGYNLFKDIRDNSMTRPTSRFIEDYSFFQLASANIYYDFSKNIASKLGAKSLRVSFSMNDIFRLTTVKGEGY